MHGPNSSAVSAKHRPDASAQRRPDAGSPAIVAVQPSGATSRNASPWKGRAPDPEQWLGEWEKRIAAEAVKDLENSGADQDLEALQAGWSTSERPGWYPGLVSSPMNQRGDAAARRLSTVNRLRRMAEGEASPSEVSESSVPGSPFLSDSQRSPRRRPPPQRRSGASPSEVSESSVPGSPFASDSPRSPRFRPPPQRRSEASPSEVSESSITGPPCLADSPRSPRSPRRRPPPQRRSKAEFPRHQQVVTLRLGPSVGQGTSGIVYPVLSSESDIATSTREVCIHEGIPDGSAKKLQEAPCNCYVAKEVKLEESTRDSILKEVYLHRDCANNCPGVVDFLLSGMTPGDDPSLIVIMEACQCELWDTLIVFGDNAFQRKSNLRVSGTNTKPGMTRASSRISISSLPDGRAAADVKNSFLGLPTESERLSWTRALCDTVRHCHSLGVLHRDLNPWNVLLVANKSGDDSRGVRLADFGLAVRLNPAAELSGLQVDGAAPLDGSALGSLYSAPELGVLYSLPADIFSLGMVLLAIWSSVDVALPDGGQCEDMLVSCVEGAKVAAAEGNQPPDNALKSIKEGCDSELRTLISRMLSKPPLNRPSALETCGLVDRWLAERGGANLQTVQCEIQQPQPTEVQASGFARLCKCLWGPPDRKAPSGETE